MPHSSRLYPAGKEGSKRYLLFLSLVGDKRDLIKLNLGLMLFLQVCPMIMLILNHFVFF